MKHLLLSILLTVPLCCPIALAQEPVQVGRGSYAEYAPLAKSRTSEHGGDQSQYMQYRKLYIRETAGQPIPTNDWWTDLINADRGRSGQEVTGHLWSYPQYVQGMKYGVDIHYPKYWVDNGTEMKAQSKLVIKGSDDFHAATPMAEQWSDWTVTFLEESGTRRMLTTLAHGMPFTWVEMEGVSPVITAVKTDADGADNLLRGTVSVNFVDGTGTPIANGTHSQFVVSISNDATADLYGVYLPAGSSVTIADGKATIAFAGEKQFVVVALLQSASDLTAYAAYAYSKPTDTRVSWNYEQNSGTLTTGWQVTAKDLRTDASTTDVLQGFIPHHWRSRYATYSHSFMSQEYATPRGKLKLAAGASLSVSYKFSGMLPWYALPNDLTGDHAYDVTKMKSMLEEYAQRGTFGNDTYWGGKGLTQMALYMSFAREMGEEELFRQCHDRLKEALVDWLTYTPGEDSFFFARDRRFGGLIGYNTSYDSDTYNDHHFHYGYYTLAAAMLCMVDDDFKSKYGDMLKLVVRDYNNYKRDDWACFLRMMDPWAGHCYAGGMGDGAGNGQESTSESMQGWGGMYLLGVALGDNELRDAGIFGWVSESRATAEYWFDRHGETIDANFHTTKTADYNIDYSKFKHTGPDYIIPYSSNLTSHGVGWWTWFGGDPVFMQGIQWMPISPALDYLGEDKAFANWDYRRLMELKEHIGWDGTGGKGDNPGDLRDSDWGNVTLAYRQWSDADDAAAIFDEGWNNNWGTMKTSLTNGITYFVTHSHRSYGDIDWTVTADCPTARVFRKGEVKTHMAFNPTDNPMTVHFSDAAVLEVPARQLKVEGVSSTAYNYVYPVDDSEPDLRERLVMKNIALGRTCTESSHQNEGTVKEHATDGNPDTRWGSQEGLDNEWIQVDLGEEASIYKVRVKWETAYASEYRIELRGSEDGAVLFSKTGSGKPDDWTELTMGDHEGRYVRLVGVKRGTQYGTSLYELEVYGKLASTPNTELMGVEIGSAKSVLKQNEANALTIKGYDYAKNPKDVTATWSSDDGAFSGSNFTPSKYGMVTVKAAVEGLTASKELPVEEALKVSSLNLVVPVGMVVGSEYAYEVEAKDQFGAVMAATPTVSGEGLTIDTEHHTITPTVVGQYEIAATMGSIQTSSPVLVLSSAPAVPEASAIGVPVFVRQEEPSMNFDYNGGSKQVGSTFMIVDNCPVVYVEKLGTFGMGALGNIDLEGANMIHADIYPLADAPDFSIHIEGAPGNKEYAKSLTGGQWNSIDLPITNTTVNWVFFAFSNYLAGTAKALVANVYFYTETGDKVFVGSPDSWGIVTVTSFGTGLTDANRDEFLSDVAALPVTATAIDLSGITLGVSTKMNIVTPNNPNVVLLLSGGGGDDNAASEQQAKLDNTRNLAYNAGGWILPLKATGFEVVFEDGYPVLPMNFGRNTALTYSRTLLAGNYGTTCLPRDVAVPTGITAYVLSGVDAEGLHFSTVTTGTLSANTPYLLYNSTGSNIELGINGTQGNVELGRNVGELSTTVDGVRMTGNFGQFKVSGTEGYAAFKSTGQLAWLSQSGAVVAPFRAYLADAPASARIFVDDEPTGIYSIENGKLTIGNEWYDLQGRRVRNPTKGIYIVNGKKILIK